MWVIQKKDDPTLFWDVGGGQWATLDKASRYSEPAFLKADAVWTTLELAENYACEHNEGNNPDQARAAGAAEGRVPAERLDDKK